ncbi:hypothetical protein CANMA_005399 [Candida margitis]|uniref:uncharacterized protein n=1 Tax=Candida margitis TaxID=1775924 RepID=UPI002225E59A|nr:uncharacterized protein CANMA_005399 [Candida margitis]KAI5950045.1 hypothetical protein CANMA_005399 [Candida margitis]
MRNTDINIHSNKNDTELRENNGLGGDQSSSSISNVEFGTLKKIGTNVSQVSTFSNSTVKSNPLIKLFTRNKSQTNVTGKNYEGEIASSSDSMNELNDNGPQKETKIAKLRAAKKILSPTNKSFFDSAAESSSTDERYAKRQSSEELRGKKPAMTSPSTGFHSLFHKSQSASGLSKFGDRNADDKLYSGSSKSSVYLSSNNSNSVVNDIVLARVYKFTSAGIPNEDNEGSSEHSSFLEIHRKMLTPADSYIQNKFNRHHQHEVGLGIVERNEHGPPGVSSDEEAKLNKSNQQISLLLKPLFVPSKQRKSSSAAAYPFLGHSLEEIGIIIRNHFSAEFNKSVKSEPNQKHGRYKQKANKSSSKSQDRGITHSNHIVFTNLDEDESRELIQDLSTIFVTCLSWLKHDVSKSVWAVSRANEEKSSDLLDMWRVLSKSWAYYNRTIRFQILHMFQAILTGHRAYTDGNFSEQKIPPTCVDEILLHSFCTVFIIPLIEQRKRWATDLQSVISIENYGILNDHERHLFQQNSSIHSNALHCLGSFQSLPQSSYFKPDIESQSLNQVTRALVSNLSDLR